MFLQYKLFDFNKNLSEILNLQYFYYDYNINKKYYYLIK
jgi:hypothetical protein